MLKRLYQKKRQQFLEKTVKPMPSKTFNRKNIYILPTKAGWSFLFIIGVILFAAINYQNNSLYLYAFALLAIYLLSILATFENLNGLEIRRGKAALIQQGEALPYSLLIQHTQTKTIQSLVFESDCDQTSIAFASQSTQAIELRHPPAPRGIRGMGRIKLETRFPFGMTRAWGYADLEAFVYVYPKPLDAQSLMSGAQSSENQNRRIESDEFVNIRSWHQGESPKRILWPAYARTNELLALDFQFHSPSPVCLDWYALEGDEASRLSQLCHWVLRFSDIGQAFSLILPGKTLASASGENAKIHALTALASFGYDDV